MVEGRRFEGWSDAELRRHRDYLAGEREHLNHCIANISKDILAISKEITIRKL